MTTDFKAGGNPTTKTGLSTGGGSSKTGFKLHSNVKPAPVTKPNAHEKKIQTMWQKGQAIGKTIPARGNSVIFHNGRVYEYMNGHLQNVVPQGTYNPKYSPFKNPNYYTVTQGAKGFSYKMSNRAYFSNLGEPQVTPKRQKQVRPTGKKGQASIPIAKRVEVSVGKQKVSIHPRYINNNTWFELRKKLESQGFSDSEINRIILMLKKKSNHKV